MEYGIKVIEKDTYLHFIIHSLRTYENIERFINDVVHECTVRRCNRVLIEANLIGPKLSVPEVFELASKNADRFRGHIHMAAYVDATADSLIMMFAEKIATNRGFPVRVFHKLVGAEEWISQETVSGRDS